MMPFNEFLNERENEIIRYIRYKAAQTNISLDEAANRSMSRLFTQVQSSDNPIVIITAFRSERTLAENRQLNKQLANDLRGLGWGYTPVLGGFLETIKDENGKEKQIRAHEESYFVTAVGGGDVVPKVLDLLGKYQQEAALLKLPENNNAMLLFKDGTTSNVGAWHADPKQMATYYTRMRQQSNRQFTFEAAGDDTITTRMAVDQFHKNLMV